MCMLLPACAICIQNVECLYMCMLLLACAICIQSVECLYIVYVVTGLCYLYAECWMFIHCVCCYRLVLFVCRMLNVYTTILNLQQSSSTEMMFVAHIKFMVILCQYLYSADLFCSFWCTLALTNILFCEKRQCICESWNYHSIESIEATYNIIWTENKTRVFSCLYTCIQYVGRPIY